MRGISPPFCISLYQAFCWSGSTSGFRPVFRISVESDSYPSLRRLRSKQNRELYFHPNTKYNYSIVVHLELNILPSTSRSVLSHELSLKALYDLKNTFKNRVIHFVLLCIQDICKVKTSSKNSFLRLKSNRRNIIPLHTTV